MDVSRRTLLGATVASIALAGCLGDDDQTNGDGNGSDDNGNDDGTDNGVDDETTVSVSDHEMYGDILVGSEGMTLYNFDQDERGADESTCYDDCEENWPPLTVEEEPSAGPDVEAEISTFERDDGTMQVVADGWPLYYFTGDEEPGDVDGQGVNDVWWVLEPDGTPIRDEEGADDDENGDDDDDGAGADDDDSGGPGY